MHCCLESVMDVKSLIKVFSNPGEFGYADSKTNARRPIALDVRSKVQSLPKRRDYSPTETDTINMSRNIAPIYKRVCLRYKHRYFVTRQCEYCRNVIGWLCSIIIAVCHLHLQVEAIIMRMLHTDRGLPMKSNRSLFRTGSANAFTGW